VTDTDAIFADVPHVTFFTVWYLWVQIAKTYEARQPGLSLLSHCLIPAQEYVKPQQVSRHDVMCMTDAVNSCRDDRDVIVVFVSL